LKANSKYPINAVAANTGHFPYGDDKDNLTNMAPSDNSAARAGIPTVYVFLLKGGSKARAGEQWYINSIMDTKRRKRPTLKADERSRKKTAASVCPS
jgi:hypothetical protein